MTSTRDSAPVPPSFVRDRHIVPAVRIRPSRNEDSRPRRDPDRLDTSVCSDDSKAHLAEAEAPLNTTKACAVRACAASSLCAALMRA